MTTKRRQLTTTKMAAIVSGLVQSHISDSLNSDENSIISSFGHMKVRDDQSDILKLGFPLSDLYKLALKFYKGKEGLGLFIIITFLLVKLPNELCDHVVRCVRQMK